MIRDPGDDWWDEDAEDEVLCWWCNEPGCAGYCNVEDYNMPHRWEEWT